MRAEHLASTLVNRNSFYSLQTYNQHAAEDRNAPTRAERNGRRDTAAISPMQKANSMIEAIRKQKQNIIENKNQLLKSGKSADELKPMLDSYNEMLQSLDDQISGIMADVAKQQAAQMEKERDKAEKLQDEEPKTEEELETQRLSNIAGAVDGVNNAEKLAALKERTEGDIRVKMTEAQSDQLQIDILESRGKFGGAKVDDMIASVRRDMGQKGDAIAEMQNQVSNLGNAQSGLLKDASDKLQENSEATVEDGGRKDKDQDGVEDPPALAGAEAVPEDDKAPKGEKSTEGGKSQE